MQKKTTLLTIIFVILAAILFIKIYAPSFLPKASPFLDKMKGIKKDSLSSLTLAKSKESLVLKKDNGVWKISNKKADTVKIDSFLTPLFPKTEPELVSESSQRHQEFQLTKDLATEAKLSDTKSLLLGKSSMNGLYVRFPDNDAVYLLKGVSESLFSLTPSFWWDKTIINLDKEKATKLAWKGDEAEVTLNKKDKKWVLESTGKEPVKEKLDAVVNALSPLTATDFAAKEKIAEYPETPVLTVTYEQEKLKDSLEFYKGENDLLVKRTSDGELFTVATSSVEPFMNFLSK